MQNLPRFACTAVHLEKGGYVSCGKTHALSFGGFQPYTLQAWIYQIDTAGQQAVVGRLNGGVAAEYSLSVDGGYVVSYRNVGPWAIRSRTRLKPKKWNHVATTYDGRTLRLYVNGVEEASAPFSSQPAFAELETLIGASYEQSRPAALFNGMVAEVRIWNVCRNLDEITRDASRHPEPAPGLVALYDFTNLPAIDRSGNARPLTLMGGARYCLCVPGLSLGGTGYADLGTSPDLSLGGFSPYTLEGWFSPLGNTPAGTLVGKVVAGGEAEYSVLVDGERRLNAYRNVHPWAVRTATALQPNEYYHFAASYDGEMLRLYVDGNLQAVERFGSQPAAPGVATLIGASFDRERDRVSGFFRGQIQNVRIWKRALAEDEIRQWIYNDPVDDPGLIASYDFTVSPPKDLTDRHAVKLMFNAVAEYVMVPLDPASLQGRFGFMLPVSQWAPRDLPLDRRVARAEAPPVLAAQPAALSAEHEAQILAGMEERIAGLGTGERERVRAEAVRALSRAREQLKANPRLNSVSQRVEGGHVILTHHTGAGDHEIFRAPVGDIDPCTLWWISFVYSVTIGFFFAIAGPLGSPTPGSVAKRVFQLIRANVAAWTAMQKLLAAPITIATGLAAMKIVWDEGLLWPLLKLVVPWGVWFGFLKVLEWAITFLTGALAAEMLASFAIWAAQLVYLAAQCPCGQPDVRLAGAPEAAGA
jgi:hypothetical protein